MRWRSSDSRELEDARADARHRSPTGLRDVAPHERPERVELGAEAADPAAASPGPPSGPSALDISRSSRSNSIDWNSSETNAVPRSKLRVTIVTRHPSSWSPSLFADRDPDIVQEQLGELRRSPRSSGAA